MNKPKIVEAAAPTETDYEAILRPLVAYNDKAGGPTDLKHVAFLIKDPHTGETQGGLWGRIVYDWMFVELLVVPEAHRGQGIGTDILTRAEAAAKANGCVGVWLDSYEFQAPEFYRRRGYDAFGSLEDHPRGSRNYFFRKFLT